MFSIEKKIRRKKKETKNERNKETKKELNKKLRKQRERKTNNAQSCYFRVLNTFAKMLCM